MEQGILLFRYLIYRKASRIPVDRSTDAMINVFPSVNSADFPPFVHALVLIVVAIVALNSMDTIYIRFLV